MLSKTKEAKDKLSPKSHLTRDVVYVGTPTGPDLLFFFELVNYFY